MRVRQDCPEFSAKWIARLEMLVEPCQLAAVGAWSGNRRGSQRESEFEMIWDEQVLFV